jgi:cytochrome c553
MQRNSCGRRAANVGVRHWRSGSRHFCGAIALSLAAAAFGSTLARAEDAPPAWAFPVLDPAIKPPPDDGIKRTLPGSDASFTSHEMTDLFNARDWFPTDHPPMPDIVAHGHRPEVRACAMCHLPNGQGRPENAGIAGLSVDYIVRQVKEIGEGKRRSSVASTRPPMLMSESAAHISDADLTEAAKYFASLSYRPWIRVVESETAPKAYVAIGTIWAPSPDGGTEPLGRRIVELPEDMGRTVLRDPHSGFVAYVPIGSIARGGKLAKEGAEGRVPACTACHGPDLRGQSDAPAIAGRPATYLVRQLFDFRAGARNGDGAQTMKPVVDNMSLDDMIDLAAYTASLPP